MSITNRNKAELLRRIADYIEFSPVPADINLGFNFQPPRGGIVSYETQNIDELYPQFTSWATQQLIGVIDDYQSETGNSDGSELRDSLNMFLKGLLKGLSDD